MASFGGTASASTSASVANNVPKSSTYLPFCHRHFQHSHSKVAFRITTKPKLRLFAKVVNEVVALRNTSEWLQKYALEQLAELSSHLYRLLFVCVEFMQNEARIIDLILLTVMSTLKISQKRKVYQPHVTLSFESSFQLCEAVNACSVWRFSPTAELGLKAILMSNPAVTIWDMVVRRVVESLKTITRQASLRVAEYAFHYAQAHGRERVSAIHKANIMQKTDGLFLKCCRDVAEKYPDIKYEEVVIDNCCMMLVKNPALFDVLVMPNLYGDIISDLCAGY